MVCLWSQPVKWFSTLTPLCSHFINPHHIMVTARKYHLHFHTIMLSFVQRFILFIWKYHSTLKSRTRPDKMFCDWSPRGSFKDRPQPTFLRSLSTLLEVSHPIWNLSWKPKSSQDGVFSNRRTLHTTRETTPARGGSDGTQRVWKIWYSRNVV